VIARLKDEAFQIYNDYANQMGSSVWDDKIHYKVGGKEISM